MADRTKLIAGNWKMNGSFASLVELEAIRTASDAAGDKVEVAICPPFTLIDRCVQAVSGSHLAIGSQDAHWEASGAHTGCIAPAMLKEIGASLAIVGHSERRQDNHEPDAEVERKAAAVMAADMVAIVCVGETEAERDEGQTLAIVGRQIAGSVPSSATSAKLVVAYEPVWAIGTGRTPTVDQIAEVHRFIRRALRDRIGETSASVRILYGGSVKPSNAMELLAVEDVDGALVGGASLTAQQFVPIIHAAVALG